MMVRHLPLDRIAEGLERHGVEARIHDGAQGRSARAYPVGFTRGCQANVIHHTGSSGSNPAADIAYLTKGRGEGWVISNAYAGRNGGIDLIASGPTYTEGRGGPRHIIPAGGANRVSNSLEVANRGDGSQAYTVAQCTAVLAWAAVCAELCAELWEWPDDPFGPGRLFAHHEWAPGRKIDPRGPSPWSRDADMWDMNAFRSDAKKLTNLKEDPDVHVTNPVRIMDTRWPAIGQRLEAGKRYRFGTELANLPAGATAAWVTLTATRALRPGFISVARPGEPIGSTSCLQFGPLRNSAITHLVPLDENGHFSVRAHRSTHLIADVVGFVA